MRFCDGQLAGYKRPRSVDFPTCSPQPERQCAERELREKSGRASRRVS